MANRLDRRLLLPDTQLYNVCSETMTSRSAMQRNPGRFFLAENMKCTQIVIQDHIVIRRALGVVDAMLKTLQDGLRIEIADAKTMLQFLRVFADQYHQATEENLLFPVLVAAAPDDAALARLVSEHGKERMLADEIEEALLSRRGMAFFRSSHQLTELLRVHCEKEETVIAQLKEDVLPIEQDEEIVSEFMIRRTRAVSCTNFARLEPKYPLRGAAARAQAAYL